jgi:hypothetical protein
MGFKEDLQFDKFRLDAEWENHPSLFYKYAEQAVEAAYERDKAKEQLDLVKAELDSDIRSDPEAFNLEKITESAISNTIIKTQKFKDANGKYLEAVKNTRILEAAREAFDHRKKALERETDLYLSGYWSAPNIKEVAKNKFEVESKQEQVKMLNENPRLKRRKE